jgi:hypothetical protein
MVYRFSVYRILLALSIKASLFDACPVLCGDDVKRRPLIAFGDRFHTPAQIFHPEWSSDPDIDPAAVPGARQRLLDELHTDNTVRFAVHFGDQQFGTLTADALAWDPLPTTAVLPPPRDV